MNPNFYTFLRKIQKKAEFKRIPVQAKPAGRASVAYSCAAQSQPWPKPDRTVRQPAAAVPTSKKTLLPSFRRTPTSLSAMDADLVRRCLEAGGRDRLLPHHHASSSSSPPSPTSAAAASSSILQSLPLHVVSLLPSSPNPSLSSSVCHPNPFRRCCLSPSTAASTSS
jgi:hypothetical protein